MIDWGTLGVIATLLALGLRIIRQLSVCTVKLEALETRWLEARQLNRDEHQDFRQTLTAQGVTLFDHEQRIGQLENE